MLNEALKQIRVFHQIKQVELADKLGISKSYLSEIESNKKPVSMDLLEKYAEYFSVPASSLMMFSENMDAAKKSDRLRLKCASKIIKAMEWISARHDAKA
ncbi:DNA-binding transcriptional regulator, XRE-family HTH domain [Thalassolituus maritimus]|uniref:DNA-binding transcriptional regulator, XRE-family HTH domain n=1 Tax=Thalassolituus maritimus TaxID=484498 RepID=A0A1N7Q6G7_9GAMM|nr:helix-turn-helix transcriptional regulator [Thalassolituus maritimus]SIT18452.1 DNA-binding transcriptional regulator, XRE-family HTH domain [Thalassolituus maritimus]